MKLSCSKPIVSNNTIRCIWCDAPFTPRHGGRPQRFCSVQHRRDCEKALREWARHEFEAGRVTVGMLKGQQAPGATRAFPQDRSLAERGREVIGAGGRSALRAPSLGGGTAPLLNIK